MKLNQGGSVQVLRGSESKPDRSSFITIPLNRVGWWMPVVTGCGIGCRKKKRFPTGLHVDRQAFWEAQAVFFTAK
jgi:hypothetical protein